MSEDKIKEMCNDIYEGGDWEPMIDLIEQKDKEIERLNNIINESAEEILKELEKNHHLSYGVALSIRQKLLDYKELKGSDSNE